MIAAALIDYRQKDYGDNVKRGHIVLGTTILALGILPVVPLTRATESPDVDANKDTIGEPFAPDARVSLSLPLQRRENLPVKVRLAVQYMPVHPRISGQEWNVQISITPVIPKLIKGVLFQ